MRTSWKRLIASVLLFCFCFSLLPVIPAAAVETVGEITEELSGHSGLVFDYEKTTIGSNPVIKVTCSIYGVNDLYAGVDVRFWFNPEKLTLANYKTGSTTKMATIANAAISATLPEFLTDINGDYMLDDTDMAGGSKSPFSSYTPALENNDKTTGKIKIAMSVGDSIRAGGALEEVFDTDPECTMFKLPSDQVIKLFHIYLGPADQHTLDEVIGSDLKLYTDSAVPSGAAIQDNQAQPLTSVKSPVFRNWPKEPEKTYPAKFIIKAGSKPIPGAEVTVTEGHSTIGTDVSDKTATTDDNGEAIMQLPASNPLKYKFKVKDTTLKETVDSEQKDVTYTMTTGKAGVEFEVSAATDAENTVTYTGMEELKATYPVTIKAVNAANEPVSLQGATVKFGSVTPETTSATADGLTFTTATTGQQVLQISGVQGYQNINVANAVQLEAVGGSTEKCTLSQGSAADPSITVEGSGDSQYVKVKLPLTVTNVTMPLPVPQVDGKNITVEQAKGMTLTFVPKQGSSKALLAEVGSGVTVSGSGITVTADTTDSTLASAISATASLPDGAYTLTVGGAGFESKDIPVTVITDNNTTPPTRVVNVGGDATLDNDGNVTQIEGGVTGSTNTDGSTDQGTGNGSIDLSGGKDGTTIVEGGNTTINGGGSVTVPDASDEGVEDKSQGGLTDTTTAGGMQPSVVTDPIYLVKVKANQTASTQAYETFTVEVRLKNAVASSGTFGLYFDPNIFDAPTGIVPNAALNIEANNALETAQSSGFANPEIEANHQGSGYVFYGWQVAAGTGSGNTAVDGRTSDGALLATITLPVKSQLWNETALRTAIAKRSIYTMDYTQTKSGQYIASQMQTSDSEAYGEAIGNTWRMTGTAGSKDSVHLDDAKATRGGFYQFSAPETFGTGAAAYQQDVMHDIRMDFELPDLMSDHRVDFWVTERDGENPGPGVGNAEIRIYEAPYDPEADPAMTPLTTLTTNPYGYAYVKLDQGKTYYYTVTEKGHWSYPNGTPLTDSDDMHYDAFRITDSGVEMVAVPTTGGSDAVITKIERDYINPRMDPTTYHEVALTPAVAGQTHNISLTSATEAYNGVDYYFTLKPDAGYTWKLASGEDMNTVAGKLTATLYQVKADAADETTAFRGDKIKENITITWDAAKEKFLISGANITGDSFGANEKNIDPLRAGDLDILVPDDLVEHASYKITATAGAGGTMDVTPPTGSPDGTTDVSTAETGIQTKVETLRDGRTVSSVYTFTPTGTNLIGKVLVNGVEQTLTAEQKKVGYTYQFLNVSSDQTIHVTFTDKDGTQLSDPYLSVTAGDHGSVGVATTGGTSDITDTVTGPATKSFDLKDATGLTVTVTPDKAGGYEIDAVVVDGKVLTDAEKAAALETDTEDPSKQYYTGNLTLPSLSLNDGDTHSVVVTFKPKGKDSIQAIVTATVVEGFGTLSPVGVTIYPIDATPEYLMTPADGWTVDNTTDSGAVKVDGTDHSDQITAPGTGETAFRYTMPPLKGNTKLDAAFSEKAYAVEGKIRIAPNVSDQATVAAATLTFKRDAVDGKTDATTVTITSNNVAANNSADSGATKLLSFKGNVPVGMWTVTVHKQGYLDYIIEGFEVKAGVANTIYFGDSTCDGGLAAGSATAIKPIPLIPGDASGDGKAIAFGDASMVVAGWLNNALPKNKVLGDINESRFTSGGGSDGDDMSMVRQNMYKSRVFDKYTTFCS